MTTVDNASRIEIDASVASDTGVEIAEEGYQECGKDVICVMKRSQSKRRNKSKRKSKHRLRHTLLHHVTCTKESALLIVIDAIVVLDTGVQGVE
jgi:hypothetical protein